MLLSPDGRFKVEVITTLDRSQSITVSEWADVAEEWITRAEGIRPPKFGVSDAVRSNYVSIMVGRIVDPTTLDEFPDPTWELEAYRSRHATL